MNWWNIATPLVSAFTGWITTWVAIKMLFHPRRPINVWGLKVQGVFPKNQNLIAEKLGSVVGKELLSFSEIEEKIISKENIEKLKPEIEKHIDYFLREKLKTVFPMFHSMIGEKTMQQMKDAFMDEMESLFPDLMRSYMNKLEKDLDLEKIVREKVAGFSSDKLENILSQITQKEFQFLEVVGAVFGLLIGILQVAVGGFFH